jgi:hypothetical protein
VYGPDSVSIVLTLVANGHSYSEISRMTGVSRSTIRDWVAGRTPTLPERSACMVCRGTPDNLPPGPYAYLLGLYLGDGYISSHRRGVYKLRIKFSDAYPALMTERALAMGEILPNRVSQAHRTGCTDVYSYSKHWPCLLPQHGPGHKHERPIVLADWQRAVVDVFPAPLLRGLVHSDGCRVLNKVNGRAYPRYEFSNASSDILGLFARACDLLDIEWRPRSPRCLSIARRRSVLQLDEFIGPKC